VQNAPPLSKRRAAGHSFTADALTIKAFPSEANKRILQIPSRRDTIIVNHASPKAALCKAAPFSSGKLPSFFLSFFYHFAVLHIRQNPQPVSRGFCNKKEERKMKKIKIKSDLFLVYPEDVKKERG